MATGFHSRGDSKKFIFGLVLGLMSTFYMFSGTVPHSQDVKEDISAPVQRVDDKSNETKKTEGQQLFEEQKVLTADEMTHNDDDTEAKLLAAKVRILCFFMTSPYYVGNEAMHVKKTWGKRCNQILFFSSMRDYDLPALPMGTIAGKEDIKPATSRGILNLRRYRGAFDWFVTGNASTFFVIENLRYYLLKQDTRQAVYFGCNNAYVLSRETVGRFLNGARDQGAVCQAPGEIEDSLIQKCLFQLGVKHNQLADNKQGMVFACFDRRNGYIANSNKAGYPLTQKIDKEDILIKPVNVSEKAVAFTNLRTTEMYLFEFYIYHLRPYGTHIEFSTK